MLDFHWKIREKFKNKLLFKKENYKGKKKTGETVVEKTREVLSVSHCTEL